MRGPPLESHSPPDSSSSSIIYSSQISITSISGSSSSSSSNIRSQHLTTTTTTTRRQMTLRQIQLPLASMALLVALVQLALWTLPLQSSSILMDPTQASSLSLHELAPAQEGEQQQEASQQQSDRKSTAYEQATTGELRLRKLADPEVTCNDGSPIGYYLRLNNNNSRSWVIHLEGGGFCGNEASCERRWQRTPELMSSNYWPEIRTVDGILSNEPASNPYLWNANHVYIPYCTSDSYSGFRSAQSMRSYTRRANSNNQQHSKVSPMDEYDVNSRPRGAGGLTNGHRFVFMGSKVIERILGSLFEDLSFESSLYESRSVLLTGESAGATGVILNLDKVKDFIEQKIILNLPDTRQLPQVRGLADSGWFVDNEPFEQQGQQQSTSNNHNSYHQDQFITSSSQQDQQQQPASLTETQTTTSSLVVDSKQQDEQASDQSSTSGHYRSIRHYPYEDNAKYQQQQAAIKSMSMSDEEIVSSWDCEQQMCTPNQMVRQAIAYWNGQVPIACSNRYHTNPWLCYFAYKTYQSLDTPLFVVQWLYDDYQLMVDKLIPETTRYSQVVSDSQQTDQSSRQPISVADERDAYIERVGFQVRKSLENVTALFAASCLSHSMITKSTWNQVHVNGLKLTNTLNSWLLEQASSNIANNLVHRNEHLTPEENYQLFNNHHYNNNQYQHLRQYQQDNNYNNNRRMTFTGDFRSEPQLMSSSSLDSERARISANFGPDMQSFMVDSVAGNQQQQQDSGNNNNLAYRSSRMMEASNLRPVKPIEGNPKKKRRSGQSRSSRTPTSRLNLNFDQQQQQQQQHQYQSNQAQSSMNQAQYPTNPSQEISTHSNYQNENSLVNAQRLRATNRLAPAPAPATSSADVMGNSADPVNGASLAFDESQLSGMSSNGEHPGTRTTTSNRNNNHNNNNFNYNNHNQNQNNQRQNNYHDNQYSWYLLINRADHQTTMASSTTTSLVSNEEVAPVSLINQMGQSHRRLAGMKVFSGSSTSSMSNGNGSNQNHRTKYSENHKGNRFRLIDSCTQPQCNRDCPPLNPYLHIQSGRSITSSSGGSSMWTTVN